MSSPLLTTRVGPYLFGAPVTVVTEILARPTITRIPHTPPAVAGVAVVRGQPLAVFTLRPAVGLDPTTVPIVLRWASPLGVALIAVDQVESLWTPGESLPLDVWTSLVPQSITPWIASGYRYAHEWLWAWPDDLPQRLQSTLTGGVIHGG